MTLDGPERRSVAPAAAPAQVRLGLRENAAQFGLLVVVNAFVGAAIGVERTAVPLLAERAFGLTGATVAASFVLAFGLDKALTNLAAGALSTSLGRRRLLLLGWVIATPVPTAALAGACTGRCGRGRTRSRGGRRSRTPSLSGQQRDDDHREGPCSSTTTR